MRGLGRLFSVLFLCLCSVSRAHAGAALLLEEPYSYDGAFAGTGHVAVYLDHVCADSPTILRSCAQGETGVVLSRYDGIGGYDWAAIPLIPYLYAVEQSDAIPLFADARLVAFLRDKYRRDHLKMFAPDRPDGGIPAGNWYELVGASYDRTVYGFEIETSPEQDALLIRKFNSQPNLERYNFMRRNCADFVREVIDFYYPHALHRSVVGDLGVTTPKQIAKMLAKYSSHHPELESSVFLLPQVPGTIRRSKPVHGVLESVIAAKKYMVPLVVLHPYIGGGLLAEYFGHRRFDPARNALVLSLDPQAQLDTPMTHDQRVRFESWMNELRMNELSQSSPATETVSEGKNKRVKTWEHLAASAQPTLDASGQPILQIRSGDDLFAVGLTRTNLLSVSESPEFAAGLLESRLRQELRSSTSRKTSPSDVQRDLRLLRQVLALQPGEITVTPSVTNDVRPVKTGLQ